MKDLSDQVASLKNVHLFQQGELQGIAIKNDFCQARFLLQGGQLIDYKPSTSQPWFWLGRDASYKKQQATRGGIPICLPWFGQLDRNPVEVRDCTIGLAPPAHGVVRQAAWSLSHIQESNSQTVICFELSSNEETKQYWPYDFKATVEYVLADTVTVNLNYKNLSESEVAISAALHSYFSVSDIGLTAIKGFDNKLYIDALDCWRSKTQAGDIYINQGVDRIYLDSDSSCSIEDQGWGRSLILDSFNSRSTVIWNPWQKGKSMSQISDDDFLRFVCVETANVINDTMLLAPNESHQLSLSVSEMKNNNGLIR